jgi:hypothetical protein
MERTRLYRHPDCTTLRDFYCLKEELAEFCRQNGLPAAGNNSTHKKTAAKTDVITEDINIEPDFKCTEKYTGAQPL